MARLFVRASSMRLTRDASPLSAVPFTFHAWAYPVASNNQTIVGIQPSGDTNTEAELMILSTDKPRCVQVSGGDFGSTYASEHGTSITQNAWNALGGVFVSNSSRTVWLNGVAGTANTGVASGLTLQRTGVGCRNWGSVSPDNHFDGRLCEVAIWNVALSDAEMVALSRRIPAWKIRPTAIVDYWPVYGRWSPELDLSTTAGDLTVVNSPAAADHLAISFPFRPPMVGRKAAAAAATRPQRLVLMGVS